MFSKVLCVFTVAAIASAEYAHSSQHFTKHDGHHHLVHVHDDHHHHGHHHHHHVDYYTHPKYEFKYQVKDPHTGNHKEHHEHRDGDSVKGHFSFKEPDGTIRHVHYHADKKTGFHADMKHSHHHLLRHYLLHDYHDHH